MLGLIKAYIKLTPDFFRSIFSYSFSFYYTLLTVHEDALFSISRFSESKEVLQKKINLLIEKQLIRFSCNNQPIGSKDIEMIQEFFEDETEDKVFIHGIQSDDYKTFAYLIDIYKYSLNFGSFKFAAYLKEHAASLVKDALLSKNNISPEILKFSLFDLDADCLNAVINNKEILRSLKLKYPDTYVFLHLALKQPLDIEKYRTLSNLDIKYSSFLDKKNIAIVGPSNVDEVHGTEINKFDIVIRPNFNFKTNYENRTHGSKVHSSYYNHAALIKRFSNVLYSSSDIDWVNFKDDADKNKFLKKNHKANARSYFLADDIFYYGSAMSAQNIVYDLLLNKSEKAKLFCFDFYVSSNPYLPDYPSKETRESFDADFIKITSKSLRFHDPFQNFGIMKMLLKCDKISVTPSLEEILNLSTYNYGSKLQNLYGKFNILC
jgi:hypothetical protein